MYFAVTGSLNSQKKSAPSNSSSPSSGNHSGFPDQVLALTQLQYLNLSYQGLVKIPDQVRALSELKQLDLSSNPQLEAVSAELGGMPLEGKKILLQLS